MRFSRLTLSLSTLLLGSVAYAALTPFVGSQDAKTPVTKEHKLIMQGIGSWAGTITMHMEDMPEPVTQPCTEEVTAVGDMWSVSRFEMEFMGTPFAGSSTFGYDTQKKKYVGTWIDAWNPTLTVMEGEYDKEKDALVLEYDMFEPQTGQTRHVRSETRYGEDSYTIQFFDVTAASEKITMEMDMHRRE